ncbi:MAG: Rpn family recombination-promoting nuclease/putative transposase [Deltaproteobacteria bacterium]|nr:Rpn family recombination-promoting nuclease/putative transposase [Deltaproteobacteria bacterium]
MNQITNPHDKFFKEVFTRRAATIQFLEHYLPPDVASLLDLNSIEFTKKMGSSLHLTLVERPKNLSAVHLQRGFNRSPCVRIDVDAPNGVGYKIITLPTK